MESLETQHDTENEPYCLKGRGVWGGTEGFEAVKVCPIILTWDNPATGRKWALTLQSLPEPKITFEGDEPTKGEMAELLMQCGDIRHALLEIFMVLAAVGRRGGA